jgi:hypothetical protein
VTFTTESLLIPQLLLFTGPQTTTKLFCFALPAELCNGDTAVADLEKSMAVDRLEKLELGIVKGTTNHYIE